MEFEAYCVKCREKRTISNGEMKTTENGRQMAQGTCPVCGTKVTRFMAGGGAGASSAASGGKSGGASAGKSGGASGAKAGGSKSGTKAGAKGKQG